MILFPLLACTADPAKDADDSAIVETDTDTDADTDTDTDVPPVDPVLDATHSLVVSSMNAIDVFAADGSPLYSWAVNDFVDAAACESGQCRAEGVTPDGEGLLVNWAFQDRNGEGGLLRLDPSGGEMSMTWNMDGWSYPHEVRRDPVGDDLIVADAFLDSVAWVPDDGSGSPNSPIAEIDGTDSNQVGGHVPNGLALVQEGGRVGLIVSYRGDDASDPGGETGRLAMWDISDPQAISLVWAFPDTGNLEAPHDPSLHWRDGRWLLLYAQSHGDGNDAGTVGVAELADPWSQPTYLADLRPASGSWGYPRGVTLSGDDTLYVADTPSLGGGGGGGSGSSGAVYRTALPAGLTATGMSGAYSSGGTYQNFVELEDVTTFAEGFDQTYRTFIWNGAK